MNPTTIRLNKLANQCMLLIALFNFNAFAINNPASWLTNEPITPIPEVNNLVANKVKLGEQLFNDPKLSADGSISCATCHNLSLAGTDGLPLAVGIKGQVGQRNTPTVLNSSLNFRLFWDGRSSDLEQQAAEPISNPIEMGNQWNTVIDYLSSEQTYLNAFKEIYRNRPNKKDTINAIAEFERSLVTPNGAFDRYLKGQMDAISDNAKKGYELFKSIGCSSCHQGVAVGGNMYEKLGVILPYYQEDETDTSNFGRYRQTGINEHKFEFKVPSLRNVTRTAPYLHDGSISSLPKMISTMAKHQLGLELSKNEIDLIVSFLQTLNGPMDAK
ncbi:MAG: cytochrome c peroxidase [Enterobacterales bacterium]|nr:cytochrome c peroxidase [Enterobacterales bacterium]